MMTFRRREGAKLLSMFGPSLLAGETTSCVETEGPSPRQDTAPFVRRLCAFQNSLRHADCAKVAPSIRKLLIYELHADLQCVRGARY